MLTVTKRDERVVEFDKDKIIKAIEKAFESLNQDGKEVAQKIADEIEQSNKNYDVEEIQNIVERKLMQSKHKDVAKAYVEYRYLHGLARNRYQELMKAVSEKLTASNVQNQNANVDEHSFGGRMGEAADVVSKRFALDYIVSPMAKANHENNEIYIHDLNSYAIGNHNCLSIPFDDLLANGFNTRQTDVRPAQSINTAFQLIAVIFQIQSLQQFGGVSATHLDWTMVPYVRKSFAKHFRDGLKYLEHIDKSLLDDSLSVDDDWYKAYPLHVYQYALDMTTKECYQAVEGMFHNLNCIRAT